MKRVFELILQLFKYHKLKMLAVIVSAAGFFFLLFPFSDLTDLITAKVMDATGNQVLFQAEKLSVGFLTGLSVEGDEVSVDVGNYPTIEAKTLSASPSLFSIAFSPSQPQDWSISADATGLFGGKVSVSHARDGSAEDGAKKNRIVIDADSIQIGEALKFINSPVEVQGKASLKTDMDFFPAMDGQPEGQVELNSKGLKLLAGSVPTEMGMFPIPNINWSQVHLKLKMGSNTLTFEDIALGSSKDPLSGRAKGKMNLKIDKTGAIIGAYEISVELNVQQAAEKDLDLELALLKVFRQASASGGKYLFKVSSNSGNNVPNLGPLSTF